MNFDAPLLLLLLIPGLALVWKLRAPSAIANALRAILVSVGIVALAGPLVERQVEGRDLIMIVDRSRSMPAGSEEAALERIRLAESAKQSGDRVGVVTFGASARVEALPDENTRAHPFTHKVDADGSDLASAIDTALELLGDERAATLLVVSDGEVRGRDPLPSARRARSRGVAVHVLPLSRPLLPDVSVERIELPNEVGVGEPFQFNAWLRSDQPGPIAFALSRDNEVISRGTHELRTGWNRLLFRDVLNEAGIGVYRLRIEQAGDRIPENDIGLGAVLVRGSKPILILNNDGQPDALSEAWRSAGLEVVTARPEDVRLDAVGLIRYRALVLENVAARRVEHALDSIEEFVVERGGGLLMTGGKASFGIGGYHSSAIDPLLPISMMLENEDRKIGVAIAFVLDRSGSMAADAGNGQTKMDLANIGTMAAIRLLSGMDAATVIAVDSSPHVVAELQPVDDPEFFAARVLDIESSGGGIYVRTGLDAAVQALAQASHANRHIVLFADAADAEEPRGVLGLVRTLRTEANTTLSVIALGTEFDGDARFLTETADAGGGSIYFSTSAAELPAMFARDTMTIARSAFLEEPTTAKPSPALFALGELELQGFPTIPGYNLNYRRPDTEVGLTTVDEHGSPLFAFTQRGLGRVAAFGAEIGGTFGQPVLEWDEAGLFFVTLGRWLAGQEEPAAFYPTVNREGRTMVVSVEVDREIDALTQHAPLTAGLVTRVRDTDGSWSEHPLERVSADRFEARVDLSGPGVHLGTLAIPDANGELQAIALPAMTLPYSPEFERSFSADSGQALMAELARAGGGMISPLGDALWPEDRPSGSVRILSRPLAWTALLLLVLMISGRRLGLWSAASDALASRRRVQAEAVAASAPKSAKQQAADRGTKLDSPGPTQSKPAAGSVTDALSGAKQRADRRTDRTDS